MLILLWLLTKKASKSLLEKLCVKFETALRMYLLWS